VEREHTGRHFTVEVFGMGATSSANKARAVSESSKKSLGRISQGLDFLPTASTHHESS
jgi:hypothetical protein